MRLYIVFLIFFISSLTIVTASEEFRKAILKRTMVEAVRDEVTQILSKKESGYDEKIEKILEFQNKLPSIAVLQKKQSELDLSLDLLKEFVSFLRNPEKEDITSSLVSEHIKKLQSELRKAKNAIQANPTVTVLQEKEAYLDNFYEEYMDYFILGNAGKALAISIVEAYEALIAAYKKRNEPVEAYYIFLELSEKIEDQIQAEPEEEQKNWKNIIAEKKEALGFEELEKAFIRNISMSLFNHLLALQQALGNAKKAV